MFKDFFEQAAFELFCDDVHQRSMDNGHGYECDRDRAQQNPAFRAFKDARTPEEFANEEAGRLDRY